MIQFDIFPTDSVPTVDAEKSALKNISFDQLMDTLIHDMVHFFISLVVAILVFYAGKYIIKKLYGFVVNILNKRNVDPSLGTFIMSLVRIVLYFILIVTVIGILGLETSSFLALFASAGVAIGMALSGTLQNFAGGVLILLLKPYKVGDYIEAQGYAGTVKAIQIFHTVINTPDNKSIIIPNGGLSTGSVNNYSTENYRRVDWTVSLSYDTDYEAAATEIKRLLLEDPRILTTSLPDSTPEEHGPEHGSDPDGDLHPAGEAETEAQDDFKAPRTWWGRLFESKQHKRTRLAHTIREKVGLADAKMKEQIAPPFVGLKEMADSSINLTVRAWVKSSDYWGVFFDMNAVFFTSLPQAGFSFPFPQLDVHFDPAPTGQK